MAYRRQHRERRFWVINVLLIALLAHSLVPLGYMPSTASPFELQICPEGLPPQFSDQHREPHHHDGAHDHDASALHEHGDHDHGLRATHDGGSATSQHQHNHFQAQHCVFAAAAGMGPAPHLSLSAQSFGVLAPLPPEQRTPAVTPRRFRIAQPRAPPSFS